MIIPAFTGIHEFMSNGHEGHPFTITFNAGAPIDTVLEYATGEHAYQAMKAQTFGSSTTGFVRL